MAEPQSFTTPRGMRDIDQVEMANRSWMYQKIKGTMRLYGFQMVEPTAMENLATLEAKAGPDIRKEIYWFEDKSGRKLGLRFDLTVGMTRMVSNRLELPEPIKLCAISEMWRYDEPQFGRYRNFSQWDAEIYGSGGQEADAEVICLGMDILESLGLSDYEVRISNRKLTEGFLKARGLRSKEKIEASIRVIDKLGKLSSEQVMSELRAIGLQEDLVQQTMEFASLRGRPDEVLSESPRMLEDEGRKGLDELRKLADILEAFDKIGRCVYDYRIVRGIGYYDGIVFEAYDRVGEDIGAIFAGGRYDGLCRVYGKRDMPATGVAGGVERIMISMERANLLPKISQAPTVFVVAVNDAVRRDCWNITRQLRRMGVPADFDLKGRTFNKQLEYADSIGVPYTIIIGRRELERGVVKLRDMTKRIEKELTLQEAVKTIGKT
ncbi:MAG: histidine--tRNA ligase [Candidatus Bathyarchaeia archaeon]